MAEFPGPLQIQQIPTEYEDRILAFIDILGWSRLVSLSAIDREAMEKVIRASNRLRFPVLGVDQEKLFSPEKGWGSRFGSAEASQFSDTLVYSCLLNSFGPHQVVDTVQMVCRTLLGEGLLTRGSIVVGKVVHRERVIFGPALIKAYGLEQTTVLPRIVIDQSALPYVVNRYPGSPDRHLRAQGSTIHLDFVRHAPFYNDANDRPVAEHLLGIMRTKLADDRVDTTFDAQARRKVIEKDEWMIAFLEEIERECQGGVPALPSS